MLVMQRPIIEALGEESDNRGRFAVAPLEPGFGHTLGNSLRRTLLSSIPGAAITTARFDDSLHEFDTIPGVAEDVTDIILNLKDIVVTSVSEEPVTMRLDARGAGAVTAGDIECPADVEVLNKDLHIATLNSKGRLAIDLTVEQGRGYLSSNREDDNRVIGVIPIDAIFSPVRRVSFEVVPTRVEQSTNYDRLVIEIETDGSITAADALASAGATLRRLVDLVATISDEPKGLEPARSSTPRSARQISTSRSRTSTCPSVRTTASSAPRSTRSANCSPRPRTTCSTSPTSARRASTKSRPSSTSAASHWVSRRQGARITASPQLRSRHPLRRGPRRFSWRATPESRWHLQMMANTPSLRLFLRIHPHCRGQPPSQQKSALEH